MLKRSLAAVLLLACFSRSFASDDPPSVPDHLSLEDRFTELSREIAQTAELFEYRARWPDARRLLETGLTILEPSGSYPTAEALLRIRLASIERLELRFDEALELLAEARALALAGGDRGVLGDCLYQWAYTLDHRQGFAGGSGYDEARSRYEESLAIRREVGDLRGQAFSLFRIARLIEMAGDDAQAGSLYEEVLALSSQHDFPVPANYANSHLGFIAERADRLEEAQRRFEEGLRLKERIRFDSNIPFSYIHLGRLHQKQGRAKLAEDFYRRSIAFSTERDLTRTIPLAYLSLANLLVEAKRFPEAEEAFQKSISEAERIEVKAWYGDARLALGKLYLALERFTEATHSLESAREYFKGRGSATKLDETEAQLAEAAAAATAQGAPTPSSTAER